MNKLYKFIAFVLLFNIQFIYSTQLSKEKRDFLTRILNRNSNQTSIEKFKSLSLVTTEELEQFLEDKKTNKQTAESTFLKQESSKKTSEDYCTSKDGGFYDDPDSCENFIICFADKTFKIPCAHGTLWDHIKKQCDYIDRIDCDRKPTTIETTTTTKQIITSKKISKKIEKPISLTSNLLSSSYSYNFNSKAVIGKNLATTTQNSFYLTNKIKNNILLLSIAIPLFLFIITSIFISLWFYKRKKRQRQERIQLNSYLQNIKSNFNFNQSKQTTFSDEVFDSSCFSQNTNNSPVLIKEKKLKSMSKWRKSKNKIGDLSNAKSFSTTHKMNDIIKNKNNIAQLVQQSKSNAKLTEFANSDHQIAIEFNPNLSFNLEENNWGYNYATRGLDLSQPWSSGHYIPSAAESQKTKSGHEKSKSNHNSNDNKQNDYLNNMSRNYFY